MNYHKIDICNMDNGDGLRVCLWVSGCNHYCKKCFNPQTWDVRSGDLFEIPQIELIKYALSQDWCKGLTLTGGDPLFPENREQISSMCKSLKLEFPTKTIWLYTGFTYDELVKNNDPYIDTIFKNIDVLVDGSYVEELKSPDKHWVGSSNQNVIDLKKTLKENKIILYEGDK